MTDMTTFTQLTNAAYGSDDIYKWRLCFEGGNAFKIRYVLKYSGRENDEDFARRRTLTPIPAMASTTINEVAYHIVSKLDSVLRQSDDDQFRDAMDGKDGGIDGQGMSFNTLLSDKIIPELLGMGRYGILVDRDEDAKAPPNIQFLSREQIQSWQYDHTGKLIDVTISQFKPNFNDVGLHLKVESHSERFKLVDGKVHHWDDKSLEDDFEVLNLTSIPVFIDSVPVPAMRNCADHQIALINLVSSAVNGAYSNNFALYVEQGAGGSGDLKREGKTEQPSQVGGALHGRNYPMNAERPAFIAPPSEPVKITLDMIAKLEDQIRDMCHMAIRAVASNGDSSKTANRPLEAALVALTYKLARLEEFIASAWQQYTGRPFEYTVVYPKDFSEVDVDTRAKTAAVWTDQIPKMPSITGRRELAKLAAKTLLLGNVDACTMNAILNEIDEATVIGIDPETLKNDIEAGLVTTKTASKARGYADGESDAAKLEHAERLARIAEAQGNTSTGSKDTSTPDQRKDEKTTSQQADTNTDGVGKQVRE